MVPGGERRPGHVTHEVVTGLGETAGKALTEHPAIKAIAFVGESATGSAIMVQGAPTLKRVSMEDVVEADQIFTMLMGEEVEPRRKFIEENAHLVSELDV